MAFASALFSSSEQHLIFTALDVFNTKLIQFLGFKSARALASTR
jgi:hypothetical protein